MKNVGKAPMHTLLLLALLAGCRDSDQLADFRSDGCSLFPDRSPLDGSDWCDCCFEHDLAYWRGGTEEERLLADIALHQCILEKTGDPALAETMLGGVRFGGSPAFFNWYRWGYGWNYGRGYAPLTAEEEAEVARRLAAYQARDASGPCR